MGERGTIAIAGAGLGGLTAALALLRRGWRVRVYEQAPVLGEVGAGISISSGSGRGLSSLGIGPVLLAASRPVPDVAFAHYRTGALLTGTFDRETPPDRGFETARHIHRADLHAILLDAVRSADPAAVIVGKTVVGAEPRDADVVISFADGGTETSDMLIAADGTRSAVRRKLFDPSPPDFAGQVAFRSLIPIDDARPYLGTGNAVVSVGAGRIFHRYPVRGGSLLNIIGIAQTGVWQPEGWSISATPAEFLAAYDGYHADVLGLIRAAPAQSLIKWGLFVREPLATWHRGRVALLGDAAHPILPFLGLGAALAIEDGIVLARALDTIPDLRIAFAAYQAARTARVESVRVQTIRQGEIIQSADPDGDGLGTSPSQDSQLFDYDPCEVPIDA